MNNPQVLPSDAADLAANRAGRVSDRQRDAIAAMEAHHRDLFRVVSGAFLPREVAERMRLMHEDLAAGAVVACDALVEFAYTTPDGARYTYTARALGTGASLHLWSLAPPGTRRLYVLPRSAIVVGSEPPDAGALGAYRDLLLRLQGISAADLTMLARGNLPPSCLAKLRAGRNEGPFAALAFGLAALGAMIAMLGLVPGVAADPIGLLVMGLVMAVGGGALGAWLLGRRAKLPSAARVEAHEGLLATRTEITERADPTRTPSETAPTRETVSFHVRVGSYGVRADHFEFRGAFVSGLPHRIWVTQPGGTAIVVEPLA